MGSYISLPNIRQKTGKEIACTSKHPKARQNGRASNSPVPRPNPFF